MEAEKAIHSGELMYCFFCGTLKSLRHNLVAGNLPSREGTSTIPLVLMPKLDEGCARTTVNDRTQW
jgi:hypothetical protein